MLRVAALTVVLSLVGTPAATAACLAWCGTPCPTAMPKSVSASGATDDCAKALIAAPGLREDSRRDNASTATHQISVGVRQAFAPNLEGRRVAVVLSHSDPPPGFQAPPTVLRL
jgi:hypothetical protein